MANWLSAAAKAFQKKPPAEPQTFELRCACGRITGGVRSATYQQVTCPACQSRLFVLPESVYPRPKIGPARPKAASRPPVPADVRHEAAEAPKSNPRPRPVVPLRPARPRRLVTPLRVLAVAIVVTAVGAMWGISRSRSHQRADADYAVAVQQGREALGNRDLKGAAEHFGRAAIAIRTLGRSDAAARAVLQLAAETQATQSLVDKSPAALLSEAAEISRSGGDSGWRETFQFAYRERWLVIDAPVVVDTQDGKTTYTLDYPVLARGGQLRAAMVLDSPLLRSAAAPQQSQRVIVAAQLESFTPPPDSQSAWQLVFKPDSAFLWSNPAVYEVLQEAELDIETRAVLARQTEAMNLTPWPREASGP